MKKHAYLVMAHNQFEILIDLLKLLDHENNNFYIHIDKKSKNIPWEIIKNTPKRSKIVFIDSINVNWGAYSMIQCTLNLMKTAVKDNCDYYHLMSGVDLPIKNKFQILDFFEKSEDIEYVHFERKIIQKKYLDRINTYYLFQEKAKNSKIYTFFGKICKKIQQYLHVNRLRNINEEIQFGANWFSITHSLVNYVIEQEEWIHKTFKYGFCADEMFLQTIIVNSSYKNRLVGNAFSGEYMSCLRCIDWVRGNPYVFTNEDFEELINSPYLFARKFDLNTDKTIIDNIYKYLSNQNAQ